MNQPAITNESEAPGYFVEEAATATSERGPVPYWLQPFFLVVCCLGGPALVTFFLPAQIFQNEWHSPKIYSLQNALTVAWSILAFGGGAAAIWFWRQHARRSGYQIDDEDQGILTNDRWMRIAFYASAALTLVGSAIWAAFSLQQGVGLGDALAALRGDSEAVLLIREKATTIPGITTLTQLGMAASVLAGLLWFRPGRLFIRTVFSAIVMAAFLRAFLRAERLALIEVVVPFCVSILPGLIVRWRSSFFRMFLLVVPAVAVAALVTFFISAEAGRSYDAKLESGLEQSAVDYGANRIGGYYGTALNNGAFLLEKLPPAKMPYYALEWLWKFPGVNLAVDPREMTGLDTYHVYSLLISDMNIEFNNTSGIFCYEYDFGKTGLLIASFVSGILFYLFFVSYREGTAPGRLFYPLCVLAAMELARIPYLTSGRAFPSVAILIALITFDTFLRISARVKGHT